MIKWGTRLIHWWMGTDALKLVMYPPGKWTWKIRIWIERRFWKIMEPLTYKHWVVHPRLINHLHRFGIDQKKIVVVPDLPKSIKIIRQPHDIFTVLYYYPGDGGNPKFKRWLYGMDVIEYLKNRFKDIDINWIKADGTLNMEEVYPVVDVYIRPTRHDGRPRMVDECKMNNIPVLYEPTLWAAVKDEITVFWTYETMIKNYWREWHEVNGPAQTAD